MKARLLLLSALAATTALSAGHLGWKQDPRSLQPSKEKQELTAANFTDSLSSYHKRAYLRLHESQRVRAVYLATKEGLTPEEAVECAGREKPLTYNELQRLPR